MKETRVAHRYAKSLLQLAKDQGKLTEVADDMHVIRKAVSESKDLLNLINSPIVKADKKGKILSMVFDGKVSKMTMDFIDILVRKHREYLVDDMAIAFVDLYKLDKGTVSAQVTTAVALTDAQRQSVLAKVTAMGHGSDIALKEKVDSSIIGGIILRVGDHQVDNSVARRLMEYRKEFSKNQYVADF